MRQIIPSVKLENDRLFIIDQRLLPIEEKIIELKNADQVFEAIKTLAVRGAPAIGIAAAYGVYVSVKDISQNNDLDELKSEALRITEYLSSSRPTAYNLFYALNEMKIVIKNSVSIKELLDGLKNKALWIQKEDLEKSEKIGIAGLEIVPYNAGILTHCNAGGLATGGNGTALSVIFKADNMGRNIFVYVDETRPLLQGARLTAWELCKEKISHKVITDSMAGALMKKGKIDLVIVGADRITLNGDFANKIGTYSLAVLSRYHGIPFYTAAPFTTFDMSLQRGEEIPIEERDKDEVRRFAGARVTPGDSDCYNPAFDVTPHTLLTGIITEFGIIYPPYEKNIERLGEDL